MQRFDEARADRFRPRPSFAKTALLVEVAEPDDVTTIEAPFGRQTFRGPFYVVADGDRTYGAARDEFEASHRRLDDGRWEKTASVLAYRTGDRCTVETRVGEQLEATTTAEPGDWIVRQPGGEVMVVRPDEFEARYVRDG